jgi:hypothetical protein
MRSLDQLPLKSHLFILFQIHIASSFPDTQPIFCKTSVSRNAVLLTLHGYAHHCFPLGGINGGQRRQRCYTHVLASTVDLARQAETSTATDCDRYFLTDFTVSYGCGKANQTKQVTRRQQPDAVPKLSLPQDLAALLTAHGRGVKSVSGDELLVVLCCVSATPLHAHLDDDWVKLYLHGRGNQVHVSLPLQNTAALRGR